MSWRPQISCSRLIALWATALILAFSVQAAGQSTDPSRPANIEEEYGLDPVAGRDWPGSVKLGLADCLRIALTRNMRLRAAGEDIEAARGQRAEAAAAFWPVMEYKYRMAPVPTDVDNAFNAFFDGQLTFFNSIHVGIGVPVTTFGQLVLAKRIADGGIEAARIRRAQTESDVIYQVKQIYYGVQFAEETIGLLEDAVAKIDKKIKDEESRQAWGEDEDWEGAAGVESKEGENGKAKVEARGAGDAEVPAPAPAGDKEDLPGIDPYDMAQLKVFKLELEKRLEEACHNQELAYEGMLIQLDLEPDTKIVLDRLSLTPEPAKLDRVQEFVDVGMTTQTDVKLMDLGVDTKYKLYKLEKRKVLPTAGVGFFVDVGRTTGEVQGLQLTDDFNDPFNFTRAGLGLEVKGTIDFHGSYARIKKARAEYHKAMYERMIARRAISVDSHKSFLEAKRAQENLKRAKRAESLAEQMMFLSKVNSDIGIGDNQRYTDSLKAVLLARGIYYKSVFDYNMALASLEKRVGRDKFRDVVPEAAVVFDDVHNGEGGGFTTTDNYDGKEEDTYGVDTEDGGTTMGDVDE